LEPLVGTALEPHATTKARVAQAWPLAVISSFVVGWVGFGVRIGGAEMACAACVGWGLRTILKNSPEYIKTPFSYSENGTATVSAYGSGGHVRTNSEANGLQELVQSVQSFLSSSQAHINTILQSPDSRKIFQFLCLNLAFMFVQLVWGVWTNSLGLISDAIHMFFDCAAIGMGLFAAVMANWKNDKVFTYGYGRVETLSGFANGVFLILISIFIVFEAVQRIIEPPVMHNTVQLLIVSSMGLAVNLFGMFAMGGEFGSSELKSKAKETVTDQWSCSPLFLPRSSSSWTWPLSLAWA